MLPLSSGGPAFTTGQRLRPSTSSTFSSRPSVSHHRKRTPVIYAHSRDGCAGVCTRSRLLITVMLACMALLAFSYNSVFTKARPDASTPFRQLQEQIKQANTIETPQQHPAHTSSSKIAVLTEDDPSSLSLDHPSSSRADDSASARLALFQSELEREQQANTKLRLELEAANEKVQAAEAAAAAAAAAAPSSLAPVVSSAARTLSTTGNPIEVPSYPPIAISSTKKYSKFFCIGGRGRTGSQNDRSCRFQNLCYAPRLNQWQFFQDPKEQLVVLLDHGKIIDEFPEQFVNARSMGNPQDAQWWSPTIVKDAAGIPAEAFVPRADPDRPTVNVLYHPHYPSNMGHVIGDDLFPIFNLMSSFGMLVRDAQLILTRDCGKIFAHNPKKAEQCDFFLNMLLPGLTTRKYLAATSPDFIDRLHGGAATSSAQQDLVCFEQLLVGNGPWGFQQSLGKAPAWWSYHAFYLNNLGLNPNRTPKRHRITVSIKKGKRALANNDELVAYLKDRFPQYEVDAIELRSLGGWKKELDYLLDTSVLITPCGGVSMSAMFLPHNSALVVVDYFNLRKNVSFGMEERLWTNLGYVRPFHYPFTLDEVEMPPDHRKDDYQELRDWGQVRVNMERMETIVKAAISHVDNFMVFGQS